MKANEKTAGETAKAARVRRYVEKAAIIKERAQGANEHEARELYLASLNTSEMYHSHVWPVIKGLARHMSRGEYSEAGAVVAWSNAAELLARAYCRIYCGAGVRVADVFCVADRCAVAVMLADSERENVEFEAKAKVGRRAE